MCKFIMATMYRCKGKGMCMTTSKCNSKKALLCVSSKLSSWSREKKVKKKNSLCVYQAFEPADQTGACFRIQEKLWEAVFTNLWEAFCLLTVFTVLAVCTVNSNYKIKTISDSTSMFGIKLKKTHFKFTQSYSFHKCCLYHQVEICPCQNLWFSNFANNLWQESKKSLAVFIQ